MQFIHDEAIPAQEIDQTFKNASWRSLFWVVVIMASITAYVAIPKHGPTNPALVAVPGGATLFFAGLFLWHLRRNFSPRNWLVKASGAGLYVNLQSNVDVPPTEGAPRAIFIPAESVESITRVLEQRTLPARGGGRYKNNFTYFDIALRDAVPDALLVALAQIRRNPALRGDMGIRKNLHGAVRVENRYTIRLVWDWMTPREIAAEAWFGARYAIGERKTFNGPGWAKMDAAAQDTYIDTLWEWGEVQDAVQLKSVKDTVSERSAARDLAARLG